MFTKKIPTEEIGLKEAIDRLLFAMQGRDCDSEEYATMADQLSKLYKLREFNTSRRVSPDTVAVIAGNIVGILLILNYERLNVVTSKALNFAMKLR